MFHRKHTWRVVLCNKEDSHQSNMLRPYEWVIRNVVTECCCVESWLSGPDQSGGASALWSSGNGGNVTEVCRRCSQCYQNERIDAPFHILIKHISHGVSFSEWSSHGVCLFTNSFRLMCEQQLSVCIHTDTVWAWHSGSLTVMIQGVWKWGDSGVSFSEWGSVLEAMCTDSENLGKHTYPVTWKQFVMFWTRWIKV